MIIIIISTINIIINNLISQKMNSHIFCRDLKIFGNCFTDNDCNNCKLEIMLGHKPVFNLNAKEFIPHRWLKENRMKVFQKQKNENSQNGYSFNMNAKEFTPTKIKMKVNQENTTNNVYNFSKIKQPLFAQYNFINNYKIDNIDNNEDNIKDSKENDKPTEEELNMIMRDLEENFDNEYNNYNNDIDNINDIDNDADDNLFYVSFKDCECCKGYVYNCKGNTCKFLGACYCIVKSECD